MRIFTLLLVTALAACGSSASSHTTGAGGAGASGTGGASATGGSTGTGGTTSGFGGGMGTGGNMATGGLASTGAALGGSGGAAATGGTSRGDAAAGTGGRIEAAAGGGGGTGRGGVAGSGSDAPGGAGGSGGTRADAGLDGRPKAGGDSARDNGPDNGPNTGGNDAVTGDGAPCPKNGRVSYTLAQKSNPTTTEQQAYTLITKAMDEAIHYYNCYTDITKKLNVTYDTSVETADGNVNGSIRFGSGTQYMVNYTAMHEIAHTVGVGQYASSNWLSFVNIPSGGSSGPWTGANAIAELRAITGDASATLTADHDHFWPYGLNKSTDPHADPDLVAHCRMVVALRKDLGVQ